MQIRAISKKHNIKISIVDITDGFKEIAKLQNTNPIATVALGKTIVGTSLISLTLKDNSKVNTLIDGEGPIGTIIAEFQNNIFRGYVQNPQFDVEKDEKEKRSLLSLAVGNKGYMQISRNSGKKETYTSRVELLSGEVNMDYMFYLQQSDQIKSLITSVVDLDEEFNVKKAVGIIVQLLPEANDEDIDFIEEKIGTLDHLMKTLHKTTNYEALIKDICDDAKILEVSELKYECSCNRKKVISSIFLLEKDTIKEIKEKGEMVEVICDFCKKKYEIPVEELK